MSSKWITQKNDMKIAQNVLIRHYLDDDREFGIEEVTVIQEGTIIIERSDWVIEIEEAFQNIYGHKKGLDVAQRVVTKLITDGKEIH